MFSRLFPILASLVGIAFLLTGCDFSEPSEKIEYSAAVTSVLNLPQDGYEYENVPLPAHFRTAAANELDNTPIGNRTTNDGATLGRVLFYEKDLSANSTISCASCHVQSAGFTDPDRFSKGFEGGLTSRNSMSLANSRFQPTGFFWDARAASLEEQALGPIQSHVEMGLDLKILVERVESKEYMLELFERAFGDREVTPDRVGMAIAQFVRSMISCQTPFDRAFSQVGSFEPDFPTFTAMENRGKQVFAEAKCASCHLARKDEIGNGAIFVIDRLHNVGLDAGADGDDIGLGGVTGDPADNGKFKVPSLRNVEVSGPYMHDGRFTTLEEVVEFYNSGVKPHPNLDPLMRDDNGDPLLLGLSDDDKQALIAFMETLTDRELLTDPRFSDPFK